MRRIVGSLFVAAICGFCGPSHAADPKPATQPVPGVVAKAVARVQVDKETRAVAQSLRGLMIGCLNYSQSHQGQTPHDLGDLLPTMRADLGRETKAKVFIDPRNPIDVPEKLTAEWVNEHSPWSFLGADMQLQKLEDSPHTIIIHSDVEKPFIGADGIKYIVAVMGDGHVESIDLEKAKEQIDDSSKRITAARGGGNGL
jgi:hypothetical protein